MPFSDLGDQYFENGGSGTGAFIIDFINPKAEIDDWLDIILSFVTPGPVGNPFMGWPDDLPKPGEVAFRSGGENVYH